MDLLDAIAIRLRETRKNKGLNQTELAKQAKLNVSTISAYENTKRTPRLTPSIESLVKISEVLGVSIDYLCGLSEKEVEKDIFKEYLETIIKTDELFKDYFDPYCIQIETNERLEEIAVIRFPSDSSIVQFLKEWRTISELEKKGTISEDMYKTILDSLLEKYSRIIEKESRVLPLDVPF